MPKKVEEAIAQFLAAIAFYTCLPIFTRQSLPFQDVARLIVLIGVLIGAILGALDGMLQVLNVPGLTRSVVVVLVWVAVTGGLHLDGAMDTADGLAVQDPQRRLQVMADSATGAFGAMAGAALLLLKVAALTDITAMRWLILMGVSGWGRWAQQVAIARYPYLKPTGKGAFHKLAIRSNWDLVPGFLLMVGISAVPALLHRDYGVLSLGLGGAGVAIALLIPAWFAHRLGGHTGDTYGAVVEWTEAFLLVILTSMAASG